MINVNGDACRTEIEQLRVRQVTVSVEQVKRREKHLKFLVTNTNGPFEGNPVSMICECLFIF